MSIKRSRLQSVIWDYFEEDSSQQDLARCIASDTKLRRGAPGSKREREFKVTKTIQSALRTRLLPNNVESLLFLKYNLQALSQDINLSSPPKEFVVPNSIMYDKDDEEEEQGHQLNVFSRKLSNDCDSDNDTDSNRHNSDEEDEDFMGFQSY